MVLLFVTVLREAWMLIALLFKAGKKVPKWGGLIHVGD
jgi:hypothetical protein